MKRYHVLTKMFAAAFLLLFLWSCGGEQNPIKTEPPIAVSVATPASSSAAAVMVSGQVEAAQTAVISTRIMGYITSMPVKAGDRVHAGQLLFTVSHEDLQAKKAQADAMVMQSEAQLANAQKDHDRYTALFKQQSATAKELENIQLQLDAAKAAAETARQMRNEVNASFSYTNVTAPFAGVITAKNADAGSLANPGMPVLTLEAANGFRVAATIPESQIALVATGDEAVITLKAIDRSITGTVAEINPSSQVSGGQYPVKIAIPREQYKGLYAGMYANISIKTKNVQAAKEAADKILIPVSALVYKDQLTGIYTKSESNRAVLRWIRTGARYGQDVEVLSGLGKDEPFIISAEGRIYNGAPVVVK